MKRRYQDMSAERLKQATTQFDSEWTGAELPGRPLTAAERKQWQRLRARMNRAATKGRPKVGEGVKVISLSIEQGLLRKADALAKRKGTSRAALVAEALRTVLADTKKRVA